LRETGPAEEELAEFGGMTPTFAVEALTAEWRAEFVSP
jgi:hypothetical protein